MQLWQACGGTVARAERPSPGNISRALGRRERLATRVAQEQLGQLTEPSDTRYQALSLSVHPVGAGLRTPFDAIRRGLQLHDGMKEASSVGHLFEPALAGLGPKPSPNLL